MNPKKTLQVTFWSMIAVQTIGSVDLPGGGGRKLPAPRVFVAAYVLWAILGLVAETGPGQARVAARLSILVLLTGALIGPFGKRFTGFLNSVAKRFAVPPPAGTTAPSSPVEEVQPV